MESHTKSTSSRIHFSSVPSLSHVRLFASPWAAAHQACLSFTVSQSLLKLLSIESVMPSNHLILCHPLLLLPSLFTSIRFFPNESALRIRWPKYWSFSFSVSPSNEHPGLISFRIDWFDLLTIQWTLKSLPQHHSSKASILWCSAFFIVQLSHPYMTTGKTIALTRWTFVDKEMSLFSICYQRPWSYLLFTLLHLLSTSESTTVREEVQNHRGKDIHILISIQQIFLGKSKVIRTFNYTLLNCLRSLLQRTWAAFVC